MSRKRDCLALRHQGAQASSLHTFSKQQAILDFTGHPWDIYEKSSSPAHVYSAFLKKQEAVSSLSRSMKPTYSVDRGERTYDELRSTAPVEEAFQSLTRSPCYTLDSKYDEVPDQAKHWLHSRASHHYVANMDKHQNNRKISADGTPGSSRPGYGQDMGIKVKVAMKLPIRQSPRDPTSRIDSGHGFADRSSGDDHSPRPHGRGHEYHNVQARENARMHLGDTYMAETMIFNQLTRPTGTEEDDKQIDLVEALAFEHMETRLASISATQGDTCRWLFQTEEYRHWRRESRHSRRRFLWIKGKPGAGKSTMMRLALHQAAKDFDRSIVAGHFFNARGHSMTKSTQGMYRALLHQIFSKMAQLPPGLPSFVAASLKKHGWPIPVLQNMLRTAILHLGRDGSLVCYIDALDECAEDDIREAVHHFEELASLALTRNTKFLICFASRHYPTITIRHHREIDLDKQNGHQQDISDYVSGALRVSGSLRAELQQLLLEKSAGVFLWAVLTVRILNKLNDRGASRAQLRARLSEVPVGVQSLFSEILQGDDAFLLPTLQWILFAQRPLTIEELYCAIMASTTVQPTAMWDETEIDTEGMRRFILASSKGLVDFSEGYPSLQRHAEGLFYSCETTVQLIHESLREHLLQGGLADLDPSLKGNTSAIVHARLAEACLLYVSNAQQRLDSGKSLQYRYSLGEYATTATVDHMYMAFTDDSLPHKVLKLFTRTWLTSELVIEQRSPLGREHCAILLCLSLVKVCQQIGAGSRKRLLDSLTAKDANQAAWNFGFDPPRGPGRWSAEERKKLPLFQAAVDAGPVDILRLSRRDAWKNTYALLLHGVLITASAMSLTGVLDVLLDCVTDARRRRSFDRKILRSAALNLQEPTTQFMLRRGAGLHVAAIHAMAPSAEWTRPADGSEATRLRIMTALLDAGVDVTNVLFHECDVKRLRVVELLKDRGARIEYCTSMADSSTRDCKHGYSRDCRAQGKQM